LPPHRLASKEFNIKNISAMFSHKIKWTIDSEKSEIIFKEKRVLLWFGSPSRSYCGKEPQRFPDDEYSFSYVGTKEHSKKLNYNLVVFEQKSFKQFWKKNTFAGLLILNDYNVNISLTLYKTHHSIDSMGAASAKFCVHGEIDKRAMGIESLLLDEDESILLDCVLLYEGEITLVQDYSTT
jgi:hypothetical protein